MNSGDANSTAALRCVLAGCAKVLLWEAGDGAAGQSRLRGGVSWCLQIQRGAL